MALDPHAGRLLAMLAAAGRTGSAGANLTERRQSFAALMRLSGPAEPVGAVADRLVPGPDGPIGLRLYTPRAAAPGASPGIVYFHGGGFVAGTLDTHDALCRSLANAARCRVVAVDYRLAPEHKFPAAIMDCYRAATWAREHADLLSIDPQRLAVGGDSAGATLAAVVCRMARDAQQPSFALQLLLCPIADFTASLASRQTMATGYLLDQAAMNRELALYLPPDIDAADPRVSPLTAADVSRLPPAWIHTAEFDPLRDEGKAYAERLTAAGVEVRHTCHPGMIHLFYAMAGVIPYARGALARIGLEIRAALEQGSCAGPKSRTSPVPRRRDPRAAADPVL
jgi:acetyl esterase